VIFGERICEGEESLEFVNRRVRSVEVELDMSPMLLFIVYVCLKMAENMCVKKNGGNKYLVCHCELGKTEWFPKILNYGLRKE